MKRLSLIFYFSLLILTIFIWRLIYSARFLDYDDNYGQLIFAFTVSTVSIIAISVLWFRNKSFIKKSIWATMLYFLTSSPLTVGLAIIYYSDLFGVTLKN
ncbi:hypothetical protein NF867_09880 [Solitalea sp. MAHUQ-68]|uniref:Uncharacterized protein n=1 Tax=Solitalea agri TaxID=2953739 RepID=A0A9X2FA26_9SPHI|nr:hypothetical protein [Solitalea agri]MCO4293173.1 hypothetical protein [Solitalea agri]